MPCNWIYTLLNESKELEKKRLTINKTKSDEHHTRDVA